MCGISAVTGRQDVVQVLYESIKNLEYRGYDSCGIGVIHNKELSVRKNTGGVEEVNNKEHLTKMKGKIGIAHTRWATHGKVDQVNAHPHTSNDGCFTIVHNGIISNYMELREELGKQGVTFVSATDTEVVVQLVSMAYAEFNDVEEAFVAALKRLEGYYALAMLSAHQPDTIYCAREGSPLVIGIAEDKNFVSSDVNAFLPYTREALMFEDGEYAVIEADSYSLFKIGDRSPVSRDPLRIEWSLDTSRKGGYAHYMLKEIFDQPQTIVNALASPQEGVMQLAESISQARTTYLMGVGTTHYVAMVGQYLFSQLAGVYLPAVSSDEFVDLAVIGEKDLLLSISQSGETFDTRRGVRFAQENGARTASIVNVLGSSLSMMVDQVIMQGSGPEICVVSTKAALAQMVILHRVALELGLKRGHIDQATYDRHYAALEAFPPVVQRALNELSGFVRNMCNRSAHYQNWLFLGRGVYHAIALEAALKMKEVTYRHVEGLPAGFLKHGTLAMVDETLVSLFFLPSIENTVLHEQTLSAVEEVKARGGPIIGILFDNDSKAKSILDDYISLPVVEPEVAPLLELVVAQLFAYFSALKLGRSIDKPRNLAKSVTVG
ncbi:MAG: glutamine--fructose-6-phosphate transaminase (isomerizing) [SAR324 cluster bacterium]|nr:glutamine--fructose-6-phosphate transaminase (isomerizing) [SAR324 cluster bacterium]